MYGITETTVHASFREIVDGDLDSVVSPIGVPLGHLAFFGLPGSALMGGLIMGSVALPFAYSLARSG